MSATHIEINGKRYDAHTGQLLAHASPRPQPAAQPIQAAPRKAVSDISRAPVPVSKHVHKAAERSHTLMRHAVKKPAKLAGPRPQSNAVPVRTAAPTAPAPSSQPALYRSTDPAREARASKIKRSELVSKFSDFGSRHPQPLQTRVEPLSVTAAPSHHTPKSAHQLAHAASPTIIEKGLASAQSHTQPAHHPVSKTRRKRSRLISAAASGMAILLLGAFITYQNVPNISMRYAAQRAGIAAAMPGYQPSGFSLSHRIQYTPGQITLSFNSNTDDRKFTIVQRESAWNSETLRTNYVATTEKPVQTYEDKGRTIYLYGEHNATWVNGGVWYDIQGDSELNSDQLIRIATSM